ncbi:phage portal protein [Rudanella paleaurantiibacter]|uniref:Phage portal protein n=1 Tax=Rudanella paleaurantiibacter TaxID=2614655 RepID=A0A7J5TYC9_9BACT|nr:phage portal protein [Rudanella paleaurantiibacter]KAB7730148.1 phage portal protein [Rudanella paleaurantiibacter]
MGRRIMLKELRTKLATALMPGTLPALRSGRLNFIWTGRQVQVLPADVATYVRAYTEDDMIFSVQDWKSQKIAAAPPMLFQVKDKVKFRQYRELSRKCLEQPNDRILGIARKAAREAALEPVDRHYILDVLERPNPMQTRVQLMYALATMLDVVGTVFVYGNKLDTGVNKGQVRELWRLPELGMMVEGMGLMSGPTVFRALGLREAIPADRVMMLKSFNPLAEINAQWHWGLSRLEPLRKSVLTKHAEANAAEAEAFQNRGARKLVFPKGGNIDDLDVKQVKEVQEHLDAKLSGGYGKVIANSMELGSIDVGSTLVDLNIIESYDAMLEKVCAVYHTRKEVHSSGKQSTFNNLTEARKSSLTDGVLPDQALIYDYLNAFFVASYNTEREQYHLEPDLDYYPELQEDNERKAKYLDHLALTENQRLEAFGYEPHDHPMMNVPMVPAGRTPVTDFVPTDPPSGNEPDTEEEDVYEEEA